MAGFIRRFTDLPGLSVLTQIEGAAIIDLPPPGSIQGVGTGVAAFIGETVDQTYASFVTDAGAVVERIQPQEIFSARDLADKIGGFDELLGDFGRAMGNLYVALRNKQFSRLVVVPINMVAGTVRLFRDLPLNLSATVAQPATPILPGFIAAGREFFNAAAATEIVRVAQRAAFTNSAALRSGTDGETFPAATSAVTFDSASAAFVAADVGRILVIGHSGTAAANRGTFRILTRASATRVTVQRLAGAVPSLTNVASHPWRIHDGDTADTGGPVALQDGADTFLLTGAGTNARFAIRVRRRDTGGAIAASAAMNPSTVPAAGDALQGLAGLVHNATAITTLATAAWTGYPVNDAAAATKYQSALDALLRDEEPSRSVNIVVCARKMRGIANATRLHALNASQMFAPGRIAPVSPGLNTVSQSQAQGSATGASTDTQFGVAPTDAAGRDERIDFCWPGVQTFVPEAANIAIARADNLSLVTTDGVLDTPFDEWAASVMSVLAPERNPGQGTPPATTVLAAALNLQRASTPFNFDINSYIALRHAGIVAPRIDKTVGMTIQSGITTSLIAGQKNINRRRMADFIQGSLAERYVQLSKLPMTRSLQDTIVSETVAFMEELLSRDNPAGQRINGYTVDEKSGNTEASKAAGVFVVITKVKTLATADVIVAQTEIGEGVSVTVT